MGGGRADADAGEAGGDAAVGATILAAARWWAEQVRADRTQERDMLKGVALWALGIPLPIILILYLFNIL